MEDSAGVARTDRGVMIVNMPRPPRPTSTSAGMCPLRRARCGTIPTACSHAPDLACATNTLTRQLRHSAGRSAAGKRPAEPLSAGRGAYGGTRGLPFAAPPSLGARRRVSLAASGPRAAEHGAPAHGTRARRGRDADRRRRLPRAAAPFLSGRGCGAARLAHAGGARTQGNYEGGAELPGDGAPGSRLSSRRTAGG